MNRLSGIWQAKRFNPLLQFLVFVIGGGLSASVDVLVTWALLETNANAPVALTVGFVCGIALNYAYHTRITFKSRFTKVSASRYVIVLFAHYLLTLNVVLLLLYLFGVETIIGKIISLPIIAVSGYTVSKFWIFKDDPPQDVAA